jgi:hypothetical protein
MWRWEKAAGLALTLALSPGLNVSSQQASSPPPSQPSLGNARSGSPDHLFQFGESDPETQRKRQRLLNTERQKELVSDTARLLKLAQELNQEVSSSESPTMSPDQVRKVSEIGKLARSVRQKMTFGLGGDPLVPEPALP